MRKCSGKLPIQATDRQIKGNKYKLSAVLVRFQLLVVACLECVGERGRLRGQSAGLVIERSRVPVPAGVVEEISFPGSVFCADSYFGIRSIPVLQQ